jgi:hypothetical protein
VDNRGKQRVSGNAAEPEKCNEDDASQAMHRAQPGQSYAQSVKP